MPRKNKNTAKHQRYVKPDYHSQNKKKDESNDENIPSSNKKNKKNKLRTSYDVYKRLIHDPNIGIDLNYICIGYEDTESIEEIPLLRWKMIDDGGDIPMHRIEYFVLYLINDEKIIIWDKKTKLDRLFCSGTTNKNTQSLRQLLLEINPDNVPKSKRNDDNLNKYERENKPDFDQDDEGKDDEKKTFNDQHHKAKQSLIHQHPTIMILNELISTFCRDPNIKYKVILSHNRQRVIQEPQLHVKLKRNDYKLIAAKTQQIMDNASFVHPLTNKKIDIKSEMDFSYENAEIYLEKLAFPYLDIDKHGLRKYPEMELEIKHETTLDCAYRLIEENGDNINIAMLNFSSARNPGGGWNTGANAQEESIARASTLIPTLTKYQNEFYDYHRNKKKTMLYSHALIYSPDIVIMKHGNGVHIDKGAGYYKCNVITSPAVNAGCYVNRAKETDYLMKKYGGNGNKQEMAWNVVEYVMRERIKRVFELGMKYDNKYLILGAWGCGVFKNDPNMIGRIFAELIRDRYYNCFGKIVFAILDDKKRKPIDKFINQFQAVFGNDNNQNFKVEMTKSMNRFNQKNMKQDNDYNQYRFIK